MVSALAIVGAFAVEDIERLLHFQCVADGAAKRLVHVGDQGDDLFAHGGARIDESAVPVAGVVEVFHEGAGAAFDVQHECVDALGHFLGHDGGDDQRDGGHGGGDVAQGVELFVGGGDFGGLADHGAAAGLERLEKLGFGEAGAVAGNGFELVERAAGDAEAAAGDHRDGGAAGGDERGEGDGYLVADAAGGMLVDLDAGDAGGIDHLAGFHHGER